MSPKEIAEELWKIRQPNDRHNATMFVNAYTWRGPSCLLKITELEGEKEIHRRIWGWLTVNGTTRYVDHGTPEEREALVQEILSLLTTAP